MTTLDRAKHDELTELIDDAVQYWCNENMVSGELAWIVISCRAEAKIAEFQGLLN